MKKLLNLIFATLLLFSLVACQSEGKVDGENVSAPSSSQMSKEDSVVSESDSSQNIESESNQRKVLMTIDGKEYEVRLYDNPVADELYDSLPLELTFEDYNNVEKIAYLSEEQQLSADDELEGYDPAPGDLCLYAPWGNLSLFYQDFDYSDGLISLGRLDSGIEDISTKSEEFTVTLEKSE